MPCPRKAHCICHSNLAAQLVQVLSCWLRLQGQDLASGNLTAPAIFALASEGSDRLRELIESEFLEEDDLTEAMHIIKEGDGLAAARRLARQESDLVRAEPDHLAWSVQHLYSHCCVRQSSWSNSTLSVHHLAWHQNLYPLPGSAETMRQHARSAHECPVCLLPFRLVGISSLYSKRLLTLVLLVLGARLDLCLERC